jgi:L-fucose isomerase-like protein
LKRELVTIGFAPTKRDVFNHPEVHEAARAIRAKLPAWLSDSVRIVDIDDVTPTGLLENEAGALAAIDKFRREKVDGLFTPHCNFGCESGVALVAAQLKVPLLLWGPRDGDPSGGGNPAVALAGRTRDSQCGLFATGKALRRMNVPFTYIPNGTLESGGIERGFKAFTAVCAAVKAFRETKVLQISSRPDAFWTVMCNEGELLERFGVRVFPVTLIDLVESMKTLRRDKGGTVADKADAIRAAFSLHGIGDESVLQMAAYCLAVGELAEQNRCNVVATTCWRAFRIATGIAACGMNGFIGETGLPVVCETDIHGAISVRLMQAAAMSDEPSFFADVTVRHPFNDNAELLWHCGNFPPCLAEEGVVRSLKCSESRGTPSPGKSYFNIRKGDVTVCRFDGDHGEYSLLMGEGKSVDGPKTVGTYCWFEVKDWIAWEEKLVAGPYIHHVAGSFGRLAPILHEACKYLGVVPDPVEPDAAWIREFWRGRAV